MITLYNKTETTFTHNGLGVLDNEIIAPKVHEELNGLFSLSFDYPIQSKLAQQLVPEMIVKAPVPDRQDQLFRIVERSDALGGLIHIVAHHIFYDLAKNFIEATYVVNKNGSQALNQILGATQFTHRFTGTSNISQVDNARLVRLNPVEVLLDDDLDNSFLSRWGGEMIRDNFSISMLTARGTNNGVQIRDKKNLTGYTSDLAYSGIVTRIMPEGYDGLFLPEKYVDSPRINQYVTPKIKVIKYDSVKVGDKEGELTQAQACARLRELAQLEYSQHHVDVPTATYEVEFAPLEKTEEYKNFSQLETINLGDTVTVIHEEDGLDISARMMAYEYDPLLQAYISVTLGNLMPKFTDIAKDIKRVDTKVTQAQDDANVALTSANGKNTNFYGTPTPANPKLGDVWYKENGDKLEMWVYEMREGVTQWFPLMTDLTQEEVKQAIEQAQAETAQALESANSAYDVASEALENATNAQTVANQASSTANSAYNKSVKSSAVTYAIGTSGTVPPNPWQSSIPVVTSTQFLWTRTVLTLQDNSTVTSYSVSKQGEKGETGNTGAAGSSGTNAPTITQVREQYYLSTSNTSQTGGSWSNTAPMWTAGKYYWKRVVTTLSDNSTTTSSAVLDEGLNYSLVTATQAKTATETLQTTVNQHATAIELGASNVTSLTTRVTTAEATLTVQAGQISSKASQSTVDTLTGRITTAENSITQNAEHFSLNLSKTQKAVNDAIGASVVQSSWQTGTLNVSNGAEVENSSYVRSGYFDVIAGKKYLLQTYEGQSILSTFGTVYLFYYNDSKAFIGYSTFSSTTPFTVIINASYLRVRLTSTADPSTINCVLLATDISGGYVNLSTVSNIVKLTATSQAVQLKVEETSNAIGVPFRVRTWQQGSLSTSDGTEISASNYLRSDFIDVFPREKYIGQLPNGTEVPFYYHFYGLNAPYVDDVPAAKQYVEVIPTGTYTNTTIAAYLLSKNVENLSITGTPTTNPYTSNGDYLAIYTLPLGGKVAPKIMTWTGRKDTSDNTVWLFSNGVWTQIATITSITQTTYEWTLTNEQQAGITSDNLYIAFFSIKNGTYAGLYNKDTTPFMLNPSGDSLLYQISSINSSGSITVPTSTVKMRVRVSTTMKPDSYQGNIYASTDRVDYTKTTSLYSSLLMTKDLINLRVAKDEVINQINVSTEGILIAGNKVRITGTTTIDDAVITSAMIKDLAVTNAKIADATIASAKIASLDAAKITTGYLNAARIQSGTITSDKLTVANGFITNAMIASATITAAKIASATITNAEIASLNADKITAGTLTGRTIQTAASGNRVVISGGQDSIYFYGSYTNGTVDQYIRAYNLSGLNISSVGTNKSFYVADHFVNDNCAHLKRLAPIGSNNWGIWVRDGTVGGHGGTYLQSNNGNYGIHITEASLNIINNGKYTRMSDILSKLGFS